MAHYPRLFSRQGHMPMWGRSIIYRCAASAAFGASFLLRRTPLDAGFARRLASGNLLQFLSRGDVFLNRVPCLGYFGPFGPLVQFYSCAASPFWLSKAFVALTLPEDSPFWTARENEGFWDSLGGRTETRLLKGPGLMIVNHGRTGSTELWTGKAPKRDPFYAQLSYHTAFPLEDEAPEGATAMTYSIKEEGVEMPFRTPLRLGFYKEENGVLYRQFNTKPSGLGDPNKGGINKGPEKIDLADIPLAGGLIRVDRIRIPYRNILHLAHFGLPHLGGRKAEVKAIRVDGRPGLIASIPGRALALIALHGWDGVQAMVHQGRHPESEESTVIHAHRTRARDYPGMEVMVTVMLHRLDDKGWSEEELSPVLRHEWVPWTKSGAPCGMRLSLRDGREFEVDFGEIEGWVCF
jgi:hypothetical protein